MQSIAAKALAETQVVPLMEAVLCVDCEMLSNSTHGYCPACGSRALLSVSTVFGGPLHAKSEVAPKTIGRGVGARVLMLRSKQRSVR